MQASLEAHLEVERRLDDFARGRLTSSAASKARSRARVMREARLAFANDASGAAAATAAAELAVARARSRRAAGRRAAALLAAAVLSLIAVGGALAASGRWAALPGPRLDRDVTLRAIRRRAGGADPHESRMFNRAGKRIERGQRRLGIATRALRLSAAKHAVVGLYLEREVGGVDAVLHGLDDGLVPAQAAESINGNIEKAINHNDAAIQRIDAGPNGNGPAGGSGAQPGAGPAAKPEATPKPAHARAHAEGFTARPGPAPTAAPAGGAAEPTPKVPPGKPTARPEKTPPGQSGG